MNNELIAHNWAHSVAKNAGKRTSNIWYSSKCLYSYNTVIGQLETDKTGQLWAFLSSKSLTPTTGKHVNNSSCATRHLNQIYTPCFARWSGNGRTIEEMLIPQYHELASQFLTFPRLRSNLEYVISHYNNQKDLLYYCADCFNVNIPRDLPETSGDLKETAKQLALKNAEKIRIANELKELARKKELKKQERDFKAWLKTGNGYCPSIYKNMREAFITVKNDVVITSQGATAPLNHVIKALTFYDTRKTGKTFNPYQTNGHKIHLGNFILDVIDVNGNVKAGCHLFTFKEIARFKKQWSAILKKEVND